MKLKLGSPPGCPGVKFLDKIHVNIAKIEFFVKKKSVGRRTRTCVLISGKNLTRRETFSVHPVNPPPPLQFVVEKVQIGSRKVRRRTFFFGGEK